MNVKRLSIIFKAILIFLEEKSISLDFITTMHFTIKYGVGSILLKETNCRFTFFFLFVSGITFLIIYMYSKHYKWNKTVRDLSY